MVREDYCLLLMSTGRHRHPSRRYLSWLVSIFYTSFLFIPLSKRIVIRDLLYHIVDKSVVNM